MFLSSQKYTIKLYYFQDTAAYISVTVQEYFFRSIKMFDTPTGL